MESRTDYQMVRDHALSLLSALDSLGQSTEACPEGVYTLLFGEIAVLRIMLDRAERRAQCELTERKRFADS